GMNRKGAKDAKKENLVQPHSARGLGYFVIWHQAKTASSLTNYLLPITNYRPQRIISVFKRI
ncbi:hypothetical protein CEN41_22025, partial [Fischerella thermalis CCMEE 5330]